MRYKQNAVIQEVNALLCTSGKVNRGPKATEEVLDESEGLDWKTMVRIDKIRQTSRRSETAKPIRISKPSGRPVFSISAGLQISSEFSERDRVA